MPLHELAQPPMSKGSRLWDSRTMKANDSNLMNLYILKGVLADYTGGMAIIAAPTEERAWEVFAECEDLYVDLVTEKQNCEDVKVIEGVNHAEGVVSYMHGGG